MAEPASGLMKPCQSPNALPVGSLLQHWQMLNCWDCYFNAVLIQNLLLLCRVLQPWRAASSSLLHANAPPEIPSHMLFIQVFAGVLQVIFGIFTEIRLQAAYLEAAAHTQHVTVVTGLQYLRF